MSALSDKVQGPWLGVVIAFDLDNTLWDPTGRAYAATVNRFFGRVPLGLPDERARQAFEQVRRWGAALERLGLANSVHERSHPEVLACLALLYCENSELRREWKLGDGRCPGVAVLLGRLVDLHRETLGSSPWAAMGAEISIRRLIDGAPELDAFVERVRRLSREPRIAEWSAWYEELESRQTMDATGDLMAKLVEEGANCAIISEGRSHAQRRKVRQLKLDELLAGRVLITQEAAEIPGSGALREAVAPLIDAVAGEDGQRTPEELRQLWPFVHVLNRWGHKTPEFFGRCLHALQVDEQSPEVGLRSLRLAPAEAWLDRPLRLVMVGDRPDKDVFPLIDLLGAEGCLKLRLRGGKYGVDSAERNSRGDAYREFDDWGSLSDFLMKEVNAATLPRVYFAPRVISADCKKMLVPTAVMASGLEAVRTLGAMAMAQPG